ncbi:periodic tryptophan protein 2 homolog [Selaginella moellendorffii]|uniref:periodic tryptophan protein 2 homolog n=1 Tax=Selaginella moellendorffii TaxID=88036 RepID=UPI000D1C26F8|nr:periodic tryptophan protein 2 homolog [Selaginella moellendorffii]XP_024516220.1 periodic tryptophan protein 2 homolog [Selaginella moellendorffii]|eukprot:XP_024516219.1 periodic tryptophan protein 2 homolog [Selaginella moellendorffii]
MEGTSWLHLPNARLYVHTAAIDLQREDITLFLRRRLCLSRVLQLWNAASGFCFVTFAEHTNAVTAALFLAKVMPCISRWYCTCMGADVLSELPDLHHPRSLCHWLQTKVERSSVLEHTFQIYVWSMKTARLVDVFGGHEGPVHGLALSPTDEFLASSLKPSLIHMTCSPWFTVRTESNWPAQHLMVRSTSGTPLTEC